MYKLRQFFFLNKPGQKEKANKKYVSSELFKLVFIFVFDICIYFFTYFPKLKSEYLVLNVFFHLKIK